MLLLFVQVIQDITANCLDVAKPQPTIRDVQAAILSIAGPVATFRTFSKTFPRIKITSKEYDNGVKDLESAEVGSNVIIKVKHGRPTAVYIKPDANHTLFNKLEELDIPIAPAFLESKLNQPSPPSITKNMKEELIAKNFVAREKFISSTD